MTIVKDFIYNREHANRLLDSLAIGKKIHFTVFPFGKEYSTVWEDTFNKIKVVAGAKDGFPYIESFFLYSSIRKRDGSIIEIVDDIEISKKGGLFYGHSFEFKLLNKVFISV